MKLFERHLNEDRLPWRARHMFNADIKIDEAPRKAATSQPPPSVARITGRRK